jgi:hypothetical protein
MSETTNLALPLIAASQAQKHVTHNEALLKLDALIHLSAQSRALGAPPESPEEGARYLIAEEATGEWSGHQGKIAAFQDGAWSFFAPQQGWRLWLAEEAKLLVHSNGAWTELKTNPTATPQLGISASADDYNRLVLSSPASLFNHAGSGHQLKLNKVEASATASLLFQTAFSGRAEMGLAGDDHFRIKVSGDGGAWRDALSVDKDSGAASFPSGVALGHAHLLGKVIVANPSDDSHNFDPSGWNGDYPDRAVHIRLAPGGSVRLTGLVGGEASRLAILSNATSGAAARLVLVEHEGEGSHAHNRFTFADLAPRLLMPGETLALLYDAALERWTELSPKPLPSLFDAFSDAFCGSDFATHAAGAGAAGRPGAHGLGDAGAAPRGIYQLATGETDRGRAFWGSAGNAFLPARGPCLYLARLSLEALSSEGERFRMCAGLHDGHASGETLNGVYWDHDGGASPHWRCCAARDGIATALDSGVLAETDYLYLGIFLNGDWTRADFCSAAGGAWSIHAPLALDLSPTQPLGFSAGIVKTQGVSERCLAIDLQALRYDAARSG